MSISIRQASMEDIPTLRQLIPESVRALSVGYYSAGQIESALIYIFGVDSQLILDGTYFVAENEGEIVGCGGWSKRKTLFGGDQTKSGEIDPLLDPKNEPARIRAFFIHPKWSRRGIGSMIIKACENAAKEAGFAKLELAATLPGEPLYKAMGYTGIERIEAPMPDGEFLPVIRMEKFL